MSPDVTLPAQLDLIDGDFCTVALDGIPLSHPDTAEVLTHAATTTTDRIDDAVTAAAAVHRSRSWTERPVADRVDFLLDLAETVNSMAERLALVDAIDSGVPIGVTRMFAAGLSDVIRGAADHARSAQDERQLPSPGGAAHLLRLPWGPAAVLAPFNAPAFTAVKKSAYALAAGCPVVLKPSPHAPHAASLLAEAMLETMTAHQAPPGLFQLIHGSASVGGQLASHPLIRCLTFTGSRRAGRAVAAAAANDMKALQLECGSNNPAVVRADADLDATAQALVDGFTKLNGQWCESPGTVLVADELHDDLLAALLERLTKLPAGSCLDPRTQLGPQANFDQAAAVDDAISRLQATGATAHTALTQHVGCGYFRGPTVITGADLTDIGPEIFGPVLVLHPVADDAAALAAADTLEGGLAGYVFTTDVEAGITLGSRLTAGEVKINGTSLLDLNEHSEQSFWAGSGQGGHGNADLHHFYTGTRIVGPDIPHAPI